jgi:hypothetical protein
VKVYVFWSGPETDGLMARNDFDDVSAAEEFIAAKLQESPRISAMHFTAILGTMLDVVPIGLRASLRLRSSPRP